ncbi:MAG: hypothetical protein LBP76_05655 [Treponema sp.]|nr:hypothetical protein [Treponema sp.]
MINQLHYAPNVDNIWYILNGKKCQVAALEIDSPQLFLMDSFTNEAVKRFQKGILSDIGIAITQAVDPRGLPTETAACAIR